MRQTNAEHQRRSLSGLSLVVRWSASVNTPTQLTQMFAIGHVPLNCAGRPTPSANFVSLLVMRWSTSTAHQRTMHNQGSLGLMKSSSSAKGLLCGIKSFKEVPTLVYLRWSSYAGRPAQSWQNIVTGPTLVFLRWSSSAIVAECCRWTCVGLPMLVVQRNRACASIPTQVIQRT
ncbi:hypothetical protein Q3G72_024739 [Acer saccharum]|nr:hypothetical protein Q3G72_024739 [Acer saccharum]